MNDLRKSFFTIVLFISIISTFTYAKTPDIKGGMWSWSMTMEMAGMQMPPVLYEYCITKKDFIPEQKNLEKNCKTLDVKVSKNSVEWKTECKSAEGTYYSKGKIIYTKTTAKGQIDVITPAMIMKSKISGKYKGSCK